MGRFTSPVSFQAKRRRIDSRMTVMLRREERVGWRERAVDRADIVLPALPLRGRKRRRRVGERHERVALSEGRQHPVGYPEHAQPCRSQASAKHFTSGVSDCHASYPPATC